MHSILALASSSIDCKTTYGAWLLRKSPNVTAEMLEWRSLFHQVQAVKELLHALERLPKSYGPEQKSTLSAILCQVLCLILQSAVKGRDAECLMHLEAAKRLTQLYSPDDEPLMELINEYTSPASAHGFPNFGLLNTRLSAIQGDLFAKLPYLADSQRD